MTFLILVGSVVSCIGMVPFMEVTLSEVVFVVHVSDSGIVTVLGLNLTCLVPFVSGDNLSGGFTGASLLLFAITLPVDMFHVCICHHFLRGVL